MEIINTLPIEITSLILESITDIRSIRNLLRVNSWTRQLLHSSIIRISNPSAPLNQYVGDDYRPDLFIGLEFIIQFPRLRLITDIYLRVNSIEIAARIRELPFLSQATFVVPDRQPTIGQTLLQNINKFINNLNIFIDDGIIIPSVLIEQLNNRLDISLIDYKNDLNFLSIIRTRFGVPTSIYGISRNEEIDRLGLNDRFYPIRDNFFLIKKDLLHLLSLYPESRGYESIPNGVSTLIIVLKVINLIFSKYQVPSSLISPLLPEYSYSEITTEDIVRWNLSEPSTLLDMVKVFQPSSSSKILKDNSKINGPITI